VTRAGDAIFAEELEKEIEHGRYPLLGASQEAASLSSN
jgi:hypothetical protein